MKALALRTRPLSCLLRAVMSAALLAAAVAASGAALPPLNEKVLAFARAQVGKSVGDGSCTTLAIEALREAGARAFPTLEGEGEFIWGERVLALKDALPGDILQFHNAVFRGRKALSRGRWTSWHHEYPHHTAIVSGVSAGGKVLTVLHQNVATHGKLKTDTKNVVEMALPIDSLQKGGWVRAFRPVPPALPGPGFGAAEPEHDERTDEPAPRR